MSRPALQNEPRACVEQNNEARRETRGHGATRRAHSQVADEPGAHAVVRQAKLMLDRRGDLSQANS